MCSEKHHQLLSFDNILICFKFTILIVPSDKHVPSYSTVPAGAAAELTCNCRVFKRSQPVLSPRQLKKKICVLLEREAFFIR